MEGDVTDAAVLIVGGVALVAALSLAALRLILLDVFGRYKRFWEEDDGDSEA